MQIAVSLENTNCREEKGSAGRFTGLRFDPETIRSSDACPNLLRYPDQAFFFSLFTVLIAISIIII